MLTLSSDFGSSDVCWCIWFSSKYEFFLLFFWIFWCLLMYMRIWLLKKGAYKDLVVRGIIILQACYQINWIKASGFIIIGIRASVFIRNFILSSLLPTLTPIRSPMFVIWFSIYLDNHYQHSLALPYLRPPISPVSFGMSNISLII